MKSNGTKRTKIQRRFTSNKTPEHNADTAYDYYLAERYLKKRRMLYDLKCQLEEYKNHYMNNPNTTTFLKMRELAKYFQ
jgi:hypothetical protein